jgi:hypothetical protein
MCVEIRFYSGFKKMYVMQIQVEEFQTVLCDVIPLGVNVPFMRKSELTDRYYVLQFWNCLTRDKPIKDVLYEGSFLDKLVIIGYDISFWSGIQRERLIVNDRKRRNGVCST